MTFENFKTHKTLFFPSIVCKFFSSSLRKKSRFSLSRQNINLWMPEIPFESNASNNQIVHKNSKKKTQRRLWGELTLFIEAESCNGPYVPRNGSSHMLTRFFPSIILIFLAFLMLWFTKGSCICPVRIFLRALFVV